MKWFELVFSTEPRLRYRRHAIFWIAWWIYFAGSYFFKQQGFEEAGSLRWICIILLKSFLLLFCHLLIVYVSIYLLLPRFLQKESWISFSVILITTVAITVAWGYFCYAILFPALDNLFQLPGAIKKNMLLWNSISAGLISSLKVVISGVAIKLVKYWWLKQKETQRLEKEKIAVELQLLKAQIHPDVLFSSLKSIYQFSRHDPAMASELLLKLSDLLSYVLYESEQPFVPLEKELKMVKDYMALQKIRLRNLEVSITVKGDTGEKVIAPLLLLPFLENSLSYCDQRVLEKLWINLDIKIERDELALKLVNGKSADRDLPVAPYENGLGNVSRRLLALYPGNNELKTHSEPEVMMTYLKINLVPPKSNDEESELSTVVVRA